MSSMLYRLGLFVTKHARAVLATFLVVLVIAGGTAVALGGKLNDDFTIPGTESQDGMEVLAEQFPELSGATLQLIFANEDGSKIDNHRDDLKAFTDHLNDMDGVALAIDPFVTQPGGNSNAISRDGEYALLQVQLTSVLGDLDTDTINDIESQSRDFASDHQMKVEVGGNAFTTTSVKMSGFEGVGVLLALVVLGITFGSLVAAGLPLVTAFIGVGISMSFIMSIAKFTALSTTTPTLAIMLGLAVGIDYSLFILHRHRELLRDGTEVRQAICFSMATSGGAVVFAGVTVIIALCGLMIANIPFLTGMGLCAAMAVGVAVITAVTALPALMTLFGEKLRPRPRKRKHGKKTRNQGRLNQWWVTTTTRHPIVTILAVVCIVGVAAVPAKDLYLSLPDNGTEPPGTPARVTYDLISEEFGPGANGQLFVVSDVINSTDPINLVESMADDFRDLDGVDSIEVATPNRTGTIGVVVIIPKYAQDDPRTADLVATIRDMTPDLEKEYNVSNIRVTGFTAVTIDVSQRLGDALLPFGAVVVGLSFVLLLIVFRSIVVPIKATLGYVFSVLTAFGVSSMVFTYGWGADIIKVESSGTVLSFMPIIVMGVLFGLAMDYEVFLVSRMREEYVTSHQPQESIKRGFRSSATVVTAAALIMTFVFFAFIPGGDFYVQQIALGLTVGVIVDAFLVRMTLVPAVMSLLGHKTWWIPQWLDRALPLFDIEGEAVTRRVAYRAWEDEHGKASLKLDKVFVYHGDKPEDATGLSVIVRPGSLVELTGTVEETQAAAALFSGRVDRFAGAAWIDGYNLRDEPQMVHSHTQLIDMSDLDTASLELDADQAAIAVADVPDGNPDNVCYVTVDALQRINDYIADGGTFIYPASIATLLELEGTHLDCQALYPVRKGAGTHA